MHPQTIDLGNGYTKRLIYYRSDKVLGETYFLNGKTHREDGPAEISYYESGKMQNETYYINGERHREDGPTVRWYYESGKVRYDSYYLGDKSLTKEEFENQMLRKKIDLV